MCSQTFINIDFGTHLRTNMDFWHLHSVPWVSKNICNRVLGLTGAQQS